MTKRNGTSRKRRRRFGRCYRRPQGKGWLVQYTDPTGAKAPSGRTRVCTKSVASEAEGKALLKEIERAIVLGQFAAAPPAEPCRMTLLEAVDEFIESKRAEGRAASGIRRYVTSRKAVAQSPIAGIKVADLGPRDVEGFMSWRRKRKWRGVRKAGATRRDPNVTIRAKGEAPSNSTVNRDVALISGAIGRLVRLGLLDKNPVARVRKAKEPTKTRAILSKEECGRLLDACDPHLRRFCLAALLTGARPSELRVVTWGDVSFGNKTITIFRTKVGVGDALPLHPQLAAELEALKKRRGKVADDEHVFLSSQGKPHWDHRWSWNKALKKAGLHRRKGLTLYSLRHSFATHFLEHGSPTDLQQLLGHASYATTERYVRFVSGRTASALRKLTL